MSEVFISYAHSAEGEASRIAETLRGLGYGVWRDDELPAHRDYSDAIEERLRAAKAVVVVWSADAVKSQWVRAEADLARECGTLVQVILDRAPLPMPFNRIQCADLANWAGDPAAPGWKKVIASVAELVGRSATPVVGAAAAMPLPEKPSIAVLPFANRSTDPDHAFFADAMLEEVVAALTRFKSLFVIASGSSLSFKDKAVTPEEAAGKLGVRYILQGSVRRAGNRVRIAVSLVDAVERRQVWSRRFDDELDDIFDLQDRWRSASPPPSAQPSNARMDAASRPARRKT
jgi:adenylate cyclase